ncbi:hypothetical protein B0H16DRAFT_1667163 [Mycena metata]|uniref:CxC2-like cysteine cluster KDZ transposase-associated domain-containing protein n=1 Tax=Mycena metata TaxID=1033252 RepID=A0AAD7H8H3_9AGAR|nr:hypothetical protein B0H16DRAFT_1667163 [Mycena metata]
MRKGSCRGSGRLQAAPPRMHTHKSHIAEVVWVSSSGRTGTTHAHIIEATGPSLAAAYKAEDLATNSAAERFDFSYDLGDPALAAEIQGPENNGIELAAKHKVYENSDYPMKTWAKHQEEYLDEMLRLEGRGYAAIYSTCLGCGNADPTFRCMQQIKLTSNKWLVVQLGHPPGFACQAPLRASKEFCLLDVTGVHKVTVNYCLCDSNVKKRQQLMRICWWPVTARDPQTCATFGVIRLFQMLNCLGKVSAHDFLRSLELLTNNDGLECPPQRWRAFRHIVRQYRTTLMMKRAGRGHAASGIAGTAQGELALRCRACPQAGRNLPEGYKYFLFLAQDCNFRLINHNVSSEAKDPILADGLGYFVNHKEYAKYLRAHVSEEEISTCSGFQAMFLANRKRVKGLKTTGVGGVTCARHNMWRPNGIGDLQLGERQCKMDFILFSALLNTIIFYLILSYDIACQYSKNFWARMSSLPDWLSLVIDKARVWFKVPNFHLPPHKPPCHSPYSFHYMWGAGRTHGETVEQNWEFTNGAAASTKMMGLGTRAATLEDLFGFHNWRRLVSWRGIFTKRMGENVKEGQVHCDAFEVFDAALREVSPEMVEGWKEWVDEWESRQHTDGAVSPFELKERVTSMRDIHLKLAKEELLRSGEGVEVEREDTPSTFIIMGLEIEESQWNLAVDVKALANPTDAQALGFLKRQTVLTKQIQAFRKLQRTYMPKVRRYLNATQRALWDSEADREVEALVEVETELRIGEAREALESLRQGLRTRTMTNRYRLRHCSGQRMLTRGQGILRQINVKIHKAKLRYRYARHALTRLKEHGPWERELKVLEESDVRALNERVLTEEEAAQRQGVHNYEGIAEEGGIAALGEGRRTLSWIWYQAKTTDPDEKELVEALRVEWCKVYARMRRWREDVVLVEEEMRRTIEYGHWAAVEWMGRATERLSSGVSKELQEGLTAYAWEQADREGRTLPNRVIDVLGARIEKECGLIAAAKMPSNVGLAVQAERIVQNSAGKCPYI